MAIHIPGYYEKDVIDLQGFFKRRSSQKEGAGSVANPSPTAVPGKANLAANTKKNGAVAAFVYAIVGKALGCLGPRQSLKSEM